MEDPRLNRGGTMPNRTTGVRLNQQDRNAPHRNVMDNESVNWIKDLKLTTKNANLKAIALSVANSIRTTDGNEVRNVVIADKTGKVSFSVWGEKGGQINPGDILRIQRGYTKIFKDQLTLYMSKNGSLTRVGEFTHLFSEQPDMSDPKLDWGPQPEQRPYQRQKSQS